MKNFTLIALLLLAIAGHTQIAGRMLGAGIPFVYAYRELNDRQGNLDAAINTRDIREEPILSTGFTADYTHFFSKRLFGNTGIQYRRLGYKIKSGLSVSVFSANGNSTLPSLLKETFVYQIVSVPVNAGYAFINNNNYCLYVKGGVLLDVMPDHFIVNRYKMSDGSIKRERSRDVFYEGKTFNTSVQFGVGAFIPLTPRGALYLEGMYYRNLFDFNKNPIGLQLNYTCMQAGYVWKFN